MHASSFENMQRCFERYVRGGYLLAKSRLAVVDVGAADVNGGYRAIFSRPKLDHVGVDCQPAPGVAIVLENPHAIPLADGYADIVLSPDALDEVATRAAGRVPPPPVPTACSFDSGPDEERMAGAVPYLATLESIHHALRPRLYFEVGDGMARTEQSEAALQLQLQDWRSRAES